MAVNVRSVLAAILVSALGGACASTGSRAAEQLHLSTLELHDSLQFGDYRVIAQRISPELRTDFLARSYGVEKTLSVLESTTISVEMDPDEVHARSLTRLSWYELPSTIVKTDNVFVHWKREGKGWLIERIVGGPLPVPAD